METEIEVPHLSKKQTPRSNIEIQSVQDLQKINIYPICRSYTTELERRFHRHREILAPLTASFLRRITLLK